MPLSELIRLNPDNAAQEVKRLLNLRPNELCTFRFYFLIYGLKDFLLSLNLNDPRQENCLIMLSGKNIDDYELTIIQKPMPIANLNDDCELIDGVRQYLKYREKAPATPLILYTENAVHLQDKFFDEVKLIANAFDFLRYYYDLPAEFKKIFGQDEDWIQLTELISSTGSFEKALFNAFKGKVLAVDFLADFDQQSKFHRWILWLHCMTQKFGYVARCAKASSSSEEFVTKIYELILSCTEEKNFDELCAERRNFLRVMKTLPPQIFIERIRQSDKKIALKILTSNSHVERLLIFETLQKILPNKFEEIDEAQKILQENFPALANYLSNAEEYSTAEQTEYFRQYRWLKVTNCLTQNFLAMVKTIAQQKSDNIFALPSRNEIVNEEYSSNAAIFFVDGLGAEYLNFLAADFSALKEKFLVRYKIGRCELPSTTEVNKDFLRGRNVVADLRELDTLKHDSRAYPENILSELDFLSALKEKVLQGLEVYEKIILSADHGTSRLAVIVRQKNFDQFVPKAFPSGKRKVYKSGRFADARSDDEKKFQTAIEYDDKIIFADYSRFVQKGTTGSEIHGGATLEEILVPVVSIERRRDRDSRFNYNIRV